MLCQTCHPSYFMSRLPQQGKKNNSLGPENCFSFLLKLKFPHVWKQSRRRSQRRAFSHGTHATHVARATFAHNTGPLKQKCFSDASSTTLAWSCYEACEVVQLSSSSSRENEKKKKILKRKKHINFLSSPLPHSYAYGVLNGLMCGFHPLIKPPTDGFLPLCSSHLLGWFGNVLVHRELEVCGRMWDQTRACVCVWMCECVCPCVLAAFVFLSQFYIPALRGESASSESPSSFLTYTSPSALVPIIEMIVN